MKRRVRCGGRLREGDMRQREASEKHNFTEFCIKLYQKYTKNKSFWCQLQPPTSKNRSKTKRWSGVMSQSRHHFEPIPAPASRKRHNISLLRANQITALTKCFCSLSRINSRALASCFKVCQLCVLQHVAGSWKEPAEPAAPYVVEGSSEDTALALAPLPISDTGAFCAASPLQEWPPRERPLMKLQH